MTMIGDFPHWTQWPTTAQPPPRDWNTTAPIPGAWIHPIYPRCNCTHCKRVRGELPDESAYIPAMRAEDV